MRCGRLRNDEPNDNRFHALLKQHLPRTLGQFDRCKTSRSAPNLPPGRLVWPSIWGIPDQSDKLRPVSPAQ
jgi:hypothetical protein